MKVKITHLTSAHPRYDTRIFVKMCSSLANNIEYDVNLIVADNKGNEYKDGVHIYDVGKLHGRLNRMLKTTKKVFQKAKELDSDIYHLHDPELIPIGIKLKKLGKKVIFDAHEDLPMQILSKPYLNTPLLTLVSKSVAAYEKHSCKKFDAVIAATPYIRNKFLKINPKSIDVNNFPVITEFINEIPWDQKENVICYIGSIAKIRGIKEIVKSLEFTEGIRLNLAGTFSEAETEQEVKTYRGWSKVNELGFLGRNDIAKVLNTSKAGLVTLHPLLNYQDALPVKMFEYMAAGIPVIASNIELWHKIIQECKCGLCVNPLDPNEIAEAIQFIISHPDEAKRMGENGIKAVKEKYNWDIEEHKLYQVYKRLHT